MNFRIIDRRLRKIIIGIEIAVNRFLSKQYIPLEINTFDIETSSFCNLKCRFCAYDKKQSAGVNMSNDMFISCVNQAVKLGFTAFHLTPCTGDVFMDKRLFDKLSFMDEHPQVTAYRFFTNFIVPDKEAIEKLLLQKKLDRLILSIYGHDLQSFLAITRSTEKNYHRLLGNLEFLLSRLEQCHFGLSVGFRSTFDAPSAPESDLTRLLKAFKKAGVGINSSHGIYNNWGGYVTQEDVAGLNMHILPSDQEKRSGPCVKLFDAVQVTASGVVNGCACRDVDASLRIGDISTTPLKDIISSRNAEYTRIIEEQEQGNFKPACRSCDYYRSIYHQPKNFRRNKIPTQTIQEFFGRFK